MKKFAGFIVVVMFSVLTFCGQSFAVNLSRPSKYSAYEWQQWKSRYGSNCYLFVNNLLRQEGRPLIEWHFTGGATLTGYTPISGGQVIRGSGYIYASDVKAAFAHANIGYVVQMYWYWSRYTPHTAIISALDDYGVEFLHSNYYAGTITNNYFSWAQLARVFNNAGSNGGLSIYQLGAASYSSGIKIDAAHFPDPVFREYVSYYDTDSDGYFSDEEINAVTDFGWHGGPHPDNVNPNAWSGYEPKGVLEGNGQRWKNIRSIEGVKLFKNLEYLYVYNNSIAGAIDISGMEKLKDFRCYGNKYYGNVYTGQSITSINASNCPALTHLECQNNNISEININGCGKLEYLDVSHNILRSLGVNVNTTPYLQTLNCSYNWLSELTTTLMDKLTVLDCSHNKLTSLYISACDFLKEVRCNDNSLTYLGLFSCNKLEEIYCNNNSLTRIYLPGNSKQNLRILYRDAKLDVSALLPSITDSSIPTSGYVGKSYSGYLRATGAGIITYSASATTRANGININSSTGTISGTPVTPRNGVTFKFTASNFAGSISRSVTVNIIGTSSSISITTSLINSLTKGTYYRASAYYSPNIPITAKNGTLPFTWSKYSGTLPTGMKLSSSTGRTVYLTGTPTSAGRYTFTVMARDKNGLYATKTFNVVVMNRSMFSAASTGENTLNYGDVIEIREDMENNLAVVEAGKTVTFIINGAVDRESVTVLVDDKLIEGVSVSENGSFTLPATVVHGDFKVSVKDREGFSEEIYVSAIEQ